MHVINGREVYLSQTLEGLEATDTPLVAIVNGKYQVAGYLDDQGIHYFIPEIAKWFGVSIESAINYFFGFLFGFATVIAVLCFFLLFKKTIPRLACILGLLFLMRTVHTCSDVYIANYFAIAIIIPVFLLFEKHQFKLNVSMVAMLSVSGLIIGYCNYIRFLTGIGVFLFLTAWLLLNEILSKREKGISLLILLIFSLIPHLHFHFLEKARDQFLITQDPSYKHISVHHPLWHCIYLGLSYQKDNPYGISFEDGVSYEKARSIKPDLTIYSSEHYKIIRDEFFKICISDPFFVVKVILMKFLFLCFMFVKYANIGLLFAFYVYSARPAIVDPRGFGAVSDRGGIPLRALKPSLKFIVPFLITILFYCLPGILVLPMRHFVLGMVCTSAIFGIYMTGLGLEMVLTKINPLTVSKRLRF